MMRNKLDYKILLGSSVCQWVQWGFEPSHTVVGWKMTRAGQAVCLVVGPASTPSSAVDLGGGACVLLTKSSVFRVWDQSCILNKALLSAHRGLDDLFRDEATYFEITIQPSVYHFSALVFVSFVVESASAHPEKPWRRDAGMQGVSSRWGGLHCSSAVTSQLEDPCCSSTGGSGKGLHLGGQRSGGRAYKTETFFYPLSPFTPSFLYSTPTWLLILDALP